MDLAFLMDYFVPIIAGICVCIGYLIKSADKNGIVSPYIPHICAVLGVILAVWINGVFTAPILLAGLFSGLAASGLYEAFKNLLEKFGKEQ